MTELPIITSERLVLRQPDIADFEPFAAFYASHRTEFIGGPQDRASAWKSFSAMAGHWLLKGFGWWQLIHDTRPIGFLGLHHPPQHADLEIGWVTYAEAEGKGFAREAATAALRWGVATLRPDRIVSYIDPSNIASVRLAERLGARKEADHAPHDAGCTVYLHDLTRYAP